MGKKIKDFPLKNGGSSICTCNRKGPLEWYSILPSTKSRRRNENPFLTNITAEIATIINEDGETGVNTFDNKTNK